MSQNDPQELRFAIQRLSRRLRTMQSDNTVTEGQRGVLFTLFTHGPQTLRSLSEHESVTPPSMNRTVNALVASGLVTRSADDEDGRKVTLDLSEAGRSFAVETRRQRDAWFTQQLDSLTAEQRAVIELATPILIELAER